MKQRVIALAIAIAVVATCTTQVDAQRRGGGARMSRPPMRSMPSRPAQMPSRQAPTRPSGGFQFNNDIGAPGRPSQLPSGGANRPGGGQGIGGDNGIGGNRPDRPGNGGNRPDRPDRPAVPPINNVPPNWGWNGGTVWVPAYGYYGGGFWGPYAWGFTTAFVFGEYYDEETKETSKSAEVAPDSPGAAVLKSYGLTQTQCGPPEGTVVILGPENSVVCATPTQAVAAGVYDLNVQDLTIAPRSSG